MASTRSRDVIIGIDPGTSLIKTVAFTRDGRQLGDFSLPNTYSTSPGGRVEQDMPRTWNDTVAALRGLATKVPDLASRAAAIAVTGQGDGTWLVDDAGRSDRRCSGSIPVRPHWSRRSAPASATRLFIGVPAPG